MVNATFKTSSTFFTGIISIESKTFWNWAEKLSLQNKMSGACFNEEIKSQFRYEFRNSIKRQKMSDVGLTSYVSGGIDSAVVALELSKILGEYRTYSVAFKDKQYDESSNQQLLINDTK